MGTRGRRTTWIPSCRELLALASVSPAFSLSRPSIHRWRLVTANLVADAKRYVIFPLFVSQRSRFMLFRRARIVNASGHDKDAEHRC